MKYKSLSLIIIFMVLLTGTTVSQEQEKSKSHWHYLADVYLMFPTMKQTAWELAGLKRIASWLEAGLGGRIVSLYTGLNLQTIAEPREGSAKKTWFDPIVIVRTQGAIKDRWLLQFRGDIGGFRVGSDFSWQIQANAGYRFSKLFQATIGYRVIGINYDKGEGMDRFVYDVDTYGPVIHTGFNF